MHYFAQKQNKEQETSVFSFNVVHGQNENDGQNEATSLVSNDIVMEDVNTEGSPEYSITVHHPPECLPLNRNFIKFALTPTDFGVDDIPFIDDECD